MNHDDLTKINATLCKNCYIKLVQPTKKEIKRMVFTDYEDCCCNCGKFTYMVDYIKEAKEDL